jgi:hypothetical protein
MIKSAIISLIVFVLFLFSIIIGFFAYLNSTRNSIDIHNGKILSNEVFREEDLLVLNSSILQLNEKTSLYLGLKYISVRINYYKKLPLVVTDEKLIQPCDSNYKEKYNKLIVVNYTDIGVFGNEVNSNTIVCKY